MANNITTAELELLDMYLATTPFLEAYPWEIEEDRWASLIVTIFSGTGTDVTVAKKAVDLLKGLDMLMPAKVATADEKSTAFIRQVLLHSGMEPAESEQAYSMLLKLSKQVSSKWDGYIQKFLRSHAEKMIKELQACLEKSGVETPVSRRIATIWLQDTCNLPVLLEGDPHITGFCNRFKLSEPELLRLLDELGLNACLADDLLHIHAEEMVQPHPSYNGHHTTTKSRNTKKIKA